MANWMVFRSEVEVFPHPNADKLEVVKVGPRQMVAQKGQFKTGDVALLAPEKSILPPELAAGFTYLRPGHRVGAIALRGVRSEGVFLPDRPDLPMGEDISAALGITQWEPPIPAGMGGEVERLGEEIHRHDVDQPAIYLGEFLPGETVSVTEKVHGAQANILLVRDGEQIRVFITSKGLGKTGLALKQSPANIFWQAYKDEQVMDAVADLTPLYPGWQKIQLCGEVIPCQSLKYGQSKPRILFYKLVVDGEIVPPDIRPLALQRDWVPILYEGPYFDGLFDKFRNGPEQVSGKELHTREGVVIQPVMPRRNKDGGQLIIKAISDKYAKTETGDELS